ncbi:retropepsin-like domain-containing protein [Candidatus Curtissbacteria bacterium]|nr:retropepsin-like domain-containing protein [Candidatus Curtissbacteria bacterium]
MKLKFPYVIESSFEFGSIPTINLWLNVKSAHGVIPFSFLFDTGADVASLPTSAAKRLGIDLDRCPQLPMSGYEGTTISVYKSQIAIEFGDRDFKIPCVFNPNNEVPILLGRAGILDRFNIFLDGKKKEITFVEL